MNRRAPRKDANHVEIVNAMRQWGVFVVDLAGAGDGITDTLCGWRGAWTLVEIKDGKKSPSRRQLTPAQLRFHADCADHGLPCRLVASVDEALSLFPR